MSKKEIEIVYKEIQRALFKLIPEKWESLYLYASVIKGRGEMYFYYFPKRTILKPRPVNCYEIANKFGINEEQYNMLLNDLYQKIKKLHNLSLNKWTNITISIVNCLFTIEYNYNDLIHSIYTDEERHIYWEHKYLHTPIESMSKKIQSLIKYYEEESSIPSVVYTEGIYIQKNEGTKIQKEHAVSNMSEINKLQTELNETPRIKNPILKC